MICEKAMALFAGGLADHAQLDHVLQRLRHSGSREGELFGCRGNRDDGFALKVLVNTQNGCSGAAKLFDLVAILFNERQDFPRGIRPLLCGFLNACEKEFEPSFPISMRADAVSLASPSRKDRFVRNLATKG
jgi:hypothetical protein